MLPSYLGSLHNLQESAILITENNSLHFVEKYVQGRNLTVVILIDCISPERDI